jgi:SAM-dependent methyltransferase
MRYAMPQPTASPTTDECPDLGLYDQVFFDSIADTSYQAAKILLPRIYELYPFNSVVDFGCGSATWLRAAVETINADHKKLTGIDGAYAKNVVNCEQANFIFQDLEKRITVGRHDLAISLEVAEHLTPMRATSFIEDICRSSDVVFFSAAVDGQGGTNHINEQPQSYWARIFSSFSYKPFIFHRKEYWDNPFFASCPYYIASSFLYIKEGSPLFAKLARFKAQDNDLLDIIHPSILKSKKIENIPFRVLAKQLLPSVSRAIKRRL